MTLRGAIVGALYGAELRMMIRDRRTLVMSLLVPALAMPVLLTASYTMQERRERALRERVYAYAITGPEADAARGVLTAARARRASDSEHAEPFGFDETRTDNPEGLLATGALQVYLEVTAAADAAARARQEEATREQAERLVKLPPDLPVVTVVYRADRDDSSEAAGRMRDLLLEERTAARGAILLEHGFPLPLREVAPVEIANLASAGQVAGLTLGRLLTPMLLLFLLAGGAVVAIDTLAGEKERGTLETLLTTAAGRAEIVAAKHLLVLTVAVVITIIQVANVFIYAGYQIIPAGESFAAVVPPLTALLLLILYLPVAALVTGVLLLVSGYARSYKEAQLYFFPVVILGLLPGAAAALPALPLRSAIVVIPVANISVAVKEILVGSIDWPFVAIAWLSTAATAVWVGRAAERSLSTERLIVPQADTVEALGGPALFPRHVLRWFAALWAFQLLAAINLEGRIDVRGQLAVNFSLLLLGTLLMIRHYRLRAVEALALRPVRPAVWVAVLAGVPAGLVTGIAVFRLASFVVPVPQRVIDSFSEYLVPPDVPLWQLVPMLTVLPGIFEELAFRGVLLHGLHRRFHPAVVALVVGLTFGLFHVSLFRLFPTAFLGVMFAAVTLLTGSIFPAMAWHAAHNALSVLAGSYALPLTTLEPSAYAAAAAILAASFWILWRTRTPYPGLRPGRRRTGPER